MANQFVGEVERLSGRVNPVWGTLAVLLKNGRPERVYVPGERLSRGLNAPLFGVLDVVQVQTDEEPVTLRFTDVVTKNSDPNAIEGYSIPELTLSVRVRINPTEEYGRFKAHIRKHGPRFADALLDEIGNGLNSRVRSRVAQKHVSELRQVSMSDILAASEEFEAGRMPFEFGSGVLQVTSLSAAVSQWPSDYEILVQTTQQTAIGVAQERSAMTVGIARNEKDLVLGLGEVGNEAKLLSAKLELLQPLADQLGIPVDMLLAPERRGEIESGARQFLGDLLQPQNIRILRENPALLNTLFANSGFAAPTLQQTNPSIDRGSYSQLPAVADSDLGTGPIDAEEIYAGRNYPDLTVDRRLASVWNGVYGADNVGELMALGSSVDGDTGTVVQVSGNTGGSEAQSAEFVNRLRRLLNVATVRVLVLRRVDRDGLLRDWILAAEGSVAEGLNVVTEVSDDNGLERLQVFVGGDPDRARDVVRRLLSARRTELPALVAVLPYADVKLYAGSPGSV